MSEFDLSPLKPALDECIPLGQSGLLPALHAAQRIYGWLPEAVTVEVSRALRVPLAEVHGVIEFYSLFRNLPTRGKVVRVCTDLACAMKNGQGILSSLTRKQGESPKVGGHAHSSLDPSLTFEASPCLGLCELAPTALVDDLVESDMDANMENFNPGRPMSRVYGSIRLLTSNCGQGTTGLVKYGQYQGYLKTLQMQPYEIVDAIKASGLVGRGGAAFPTGVKWEGAANADGDTKYIVCNADESEPGTFKDRILLMDDPHRVIEGMCIAARAIGAARGYIYLRGEYPYILPILDEALREARSAGYLGRKEEMPNGSFDIEIRLGGGAYICGEETALFESIEGKRGFPRVKPPFPTTHGLFGQPTVINNVETLCNVPLVIKEGAQAYRKLGSEKSPGPKLFCLSGDVTHPGLYEIPFGVTLQELLEMAGGVAQGRPFKAALFGGAAGAFADSTQLKVKLTFEDLRTAGLPLGSGVVMVFDESRDIRQVLAGLGHFFAHESCGKCYPCQMGTQRQKEILDRIAAGRVLKEDVLRLQDVGWTMTDASLCGLGQTAGSAVLSAIKLWPDLFAVPSLHRNARAAQQDGSRRREPSSPVKKTGKSTSRGKSPGKSKSRK